jgi:hypothetical protein
LFIDLGALDERVEDVEDTIAAPCVRIFAQDLGFGLIGGGPRDSVAVPTEGFELVDELIDNVPRPIVLMESISCESGKEWLVMLTFGTSRSTGPSELRM